MDDEKKRKEKINQQTKIYMEHTYIFWKRMDGDSIKSLLYHIII